MQDSCDQECQSQPCYAQQLGADHTLRTASQPFDVLGYGSLSAVKWTLIIDKETEEPYLHIDELPNDANKHTEFFVALAFQTLCLPFGDITSKIQEQTLGKTATPITQERYLNC